MDASQRLFETPKFYSEFEPVCQQIEILNKEYADKYLPWHRQFTLIKREWISALSQLNRLHETGMAPDPARFNSIDESFEAFHNQKAHYDQVSGNIQSEIGILLSKIKEMWHQIQEEKSNGFLSTAKYWEYIRMIKNVIKNGHEMSCYQDGFFS